MVFDVVDILVKGNVGVCVVKIDVEVMGVLFVEIIICSVGDYDVVGEISLMSSNYINVLFSLSLNVELIDEVYLCFGVSKIVICLMFL